MLNFQLVNIGLKNSIEFKNKGFRSYSWDGKDHVKYDKVGIQPSAIKYKLITYSNQEILLFGLIKSKIKIPAIDLRRQQG